MTLTISAATEADLPGLLALYHHLTGDPPPPDAVSRLMFQRFHLYPGSAILLGHVAHTPVATCALVVIPNLTRGGAPYALIENVVTAPAHRNQGHGKALLHAATDRAWAAGCYKTMLLTGSTDPATLTFYTSAGFTQTKTGFQMRRLPPRPF